MVMLMPIGARLAARGVMPRRVSAKRSWPPGCGRFPAASPAPEAGDGEKGATGGVIEDRVEVLLEGMVDVRKEGGEERSSRTVDDVPGEPERESSAIEVMPPASSADPKSFVAAAAAADSTAKDGAEPLLVDRHDDAVRKKKRFLTSAVNPPPKRRVISAVRKFPPGC